MEDLSEPKRCPKCRAEIPPEAPQGLCPKCLLFEASIATAAGTATLSKAVPPEIGALTAAFPQLEILEMIGQGGMGFVFKARQPKLDRFVALKILPESLAGDPAFADRFAREGRVLARLNHPNIVTVHDFGQANGLFYLLMEYVDGVNLRQAMKAGRFTPEQALAIVPRICDALQFAHNEGILHRDIKPENILLDSKGRVKIADFGIAKIVGTETAASADQTAGAVEHAVTGVIGTPHYMAPEQLENPREVDQRADIYSLGVVFYEMLTGELPLGRFAPPSERTTVDPRLDEVVLRALEKQPERRTSSAGEVRTQVETITQGAPPVVHLAEEAAPQAGAFSKQERIALALRRGALAGIAVFLLIVFGATVLSLLLPKSYMATARVDIDSGANNSDPYPIHREMELIKSQDFLEKVAASMELSTRWGDKYRGPGIELDPESVVRMLRERLDLRTSRNTSLIEIRFYADSAPEAAVMANRIAELYCQQEPGGRRSLIDSAETPNKPVRPKLPLNVAIGALIGLGAGLVASLLVGLLSYSRSRTAVSPSPAGDRSDSPPLNERELAKQERLLRALGHGAIVGLMVFLVLSPDPPANTSIAGLGVAAGLLAGLSFGLLSYSRSRHAVAEDASSTAIARLPWALIIVAMLFIASGTSSVWTVVSDLKQDTYNFNLGVLALPIGIGLLRRRPWWRITGLVFIWSGFAIMILAAAVAALGWKGDATLAPRAKIFGRVVTGDDAIGIAVLIGIGFTVLLAWMHWVLARREVKSLFQRGGFVRPWIEWGTLALVFLLHFAMERWTPFGAPETEVLAPPITSAPQQTGNTAPPLETIRADQ